MTTPTAEEVQKLIELLRFIDACSMDSLAINDATIEAAVALQSLHDAKERAEANAARYEWLRQMIFDDRIIVQPDRMLHGAELDAAIDNAREGGRG